jgi:hypothetical protein
MKKHHLSQYQYTAREVVSGLQFIAYAQECSLTYANLFAEIIIGHLKKCKIDLIPPLAGYITKLCFEKSSGFVDLVDIRCLLSFQKVSFILERIHLLSLQVKTNFAHKYLHHLFQRRIKKVCLRNIIMSVVCK